MEANKRMKLLAAIDLGGTNVALGFGTPEGELLHSASFPTEGNLGPEHVLQRIAWFVEDQLPAVLPNRAQIAAVGMGLPGRLDARRRSTEFLPNLATQWREVPVAEMLEARLRCPVFLLNDARLAALGELDFGHGRQFRDFLFVTLGTGIGGAVVLDGHLRLGPSGAAGELGHQSIDPNGPLCGCGARGCLEAMASASALTAEGLRLMRIGQAPHLASLLKGDLNLLSVELMAAAEDAALEGAIAETGRRLGLGMANLVTALHPEGIVFSGGMAQLGDRLLGPARQEMLRRVRMFSAANVEMLPSALGAHAALLGGLALAARLGQL
ncbi:MAG: ROK family protein [Bryobacter sp.]